MRNQWLTYAIRLHRWLEHMCVCVCVHLLAQFISGVLNCEVARGGGKGSREHTTLSTERVSIPIYRGERVGVYENFFVHWHSALSLSSSSSSILFFIYKVSSSSRSCRSGCLAQRGWNSHFWAINVYRFPAALRFRSNLFVAVLRAKSMSDLQNVSFGRSRSLNLLGCAEGDPFWKACFSYTHCRIEMRVLDLLISGARVRPLF
jgi:hypothetical protein